LKRGLAALLLAGVAAACAHPRAPRPLDTDDYVFPTARPGELRPAEAQAFEKAWRSVLAGEATRAEKDFGRLLAVRPGLVPVETGLAYANLRAGRVSQASGGFEAALARRPEYVPAMMGAASIAVRKGELGRALDLYRRAQLAQPDDSRSRRRLAEVKLRLTESSVAAAKAASDAGDTAGAIAAYQQALRAAPEVTGLRLSLADALIDQGDAAGAVDVLAQDPVGDRQARLRQAEVLYGMGEYGRSLEVAEALLARDPRDPDALRRAREAREAQSLLQLPEEYRRIPTALRVTRAEMAALVSVNLSGLSRLPAGEPELAVDIAGSWARDHIVRVLALGAMDVYPNHTFQPGAFVRRSDLARVCARVLDLLRVAPGAVPSPTDLAPTSFFYEDAVRAVGAGLLELTPEGAFEPGRFVTGREALDVVQALGRLDPP
jgi:thioredoxin-like negative regulator of GroEL